MCLVILEEKFLSYDLIIQNLLKVSGDFGRENPILWLSYTKLIESVGYFWKRNSHSSVGRAFAFGAGGCGFEFRGRTIPKV